MAQVPTDRLELKDAKVLSPPIVGAPLYGCATAVSVLGFVPHAKLDLRINGVTVLSAVPAGFPQPQGALLALPSPLQPGDLVRARQKANGLTSGGQTPRSFVMRSTARSPRHQKDDVSRHRPLPRARCHQRRAIGPEAAPSTSSARIGTWLRACNRAITAPRSTASISPSVISPPGATAL